MAPSLLGSEPAAATVSLRLKALVFRVSSIWPIMQIHVGVHFAPLLGVPLVLWELGTSITKDGQFQNCNYGMRWLV